MSVPNEYINASISVPDATEIGIAIKCAPKGLLAKLRVVQLTGAKEGFSYCLYNTIAACPPGTSPTSSATAPEKLYRLLPLLVVTAGNDSYVSAEGYPEDGVNNLDTYFVNLDAPGATLAAGALAGTPTNRNRYLYLKIIAVGTGAKTFGYAMTLVEPEYNS